MNHEQHKYKVIDRVSSLYARFFAKNVREAILSNVQEDWKQQIVKLAEERYQKYVMNKTIISQRLLHNELSQNNKADQIANEKSRQLSAKPTAYKVELNEEEKGNND